MLRCGAADRFTLWGLEMLEMYLGLFMINARDLCGLTGQMFSAVAMDGDRPLPEFFHESIKKTLAGLEKNSRGIYLSHLMRVKVTRAVSFFETAEHITTRTAAEALKQLYEDLIVESASHAFLMIPADKRVLFRQPEPPFGEEVAAMFPDAQTDIRDGTRCLAFDEWTAAVFHLMRAAEWALKHLAGEMGVQDIERKDFGQLVQETRDKHNAISSRDPSKQYSADALASLGLFKDAWRNPVAHARDHYDERRAMDVWNGVRAFMQSLTRRPA